MKTNGDEKQNAIQARSMIQANKRWPGWQLTFSIIFIISYFTLQVEVLTKLSPAVTAINLWVMAHPCKLRCATTAARLSKLKLTELRLEDV